MNNENFLIHYGKPGMKWGVQNGPPYPLYRQERFKEAGAYEKRMNSKSGGGAQSSKKNSSTTKNVQAAKSHKSIGIKNNREGLSQRNRKTPVSTKYGSTNFLSRFKKTEEQKTEEALAKREKDINSGNIDVTSMTDEELNKAIIRIRNQETYLKLVGKETPAEAAQRIKQEKSESLTRAVVKDLKNSLVVPMVRGAAAYGIRRVLTDNTNLSEEAIESIFSGVNKVGKQSKKGDNTSQNTSQNTSKQQKKLEKQQLKKEQKSQEQAEKRLEQLQQKQQKSQEQAQKKQEQLQQKQLKQEQKQQQKQQKQQKKQEQLQQKQQKKEQKQQTDNSKNTLSVVELNSAKDINEFIKKYNLRKR